MSIPNNVSSLLWISNTDLTFNTSKWRDQAFLNYWVIVKVINKKSNFAQVYQLQFPEMYVRSPETKLVSQKNRTNYFRPTALWNWTDLNKRISKEMHINWKFNLHYMIFIFIKLQFFCGNWKYLFAFMSNFSHRFSDIYFNICRNFINQELHNLIKQTANSIGTLWLISGLKDK